MRQAIIKNGTIHEKCWLDEHPKLEKGCFVTLKDEDGIWEVVELFDISISKEYLYKTWHVGGL